ncbi:hypothetical protein IHE45_04G088700 [Dioscorea alata]|uniref:Uncharacterized protein LOC120259116 n=2 Tax=Dioscorea TaxID=4672 RepID=A0AB40B5N9_DIOCR|nr:uncharacterized protein LOC120259116 [Dioscorea cayenensis subsp. rotundata]KAH7686208.1 hypothetical protein IHE45_04G088700 [Dioscorea alata]
MATLQLFKLFGMQCTTVSQSPSRSPVGKRAAAASGSPSVQLRRRVTLKKLLSRSPSRRFVPRGKPSGGKPADPEERKGLLSHTLRDLLVSSPPSEDEGGDGGRGGGGFRFESGSGGRRGAGVSRFRSVSLRQRLMRRAWRPVLVAIPE